MGRVRLAAVKSWPVLLPVAETAENVRAGCAVCIKTGALQTNALKQASVTLAATTNPTSHEEAGTTCTRSFPKFSPRRRPIRARGAFSSPSTTSSRYLIRPSPTQAETSRMKSP
jgi:hypothetical protein